MKFAVLAAILFSLAACRRSDPLPAYSPVGNFQLTDQNGKAFDSRSLTGNIWVADFIYTQCPGPCPRMTSQLHSVQQATARLPNLRLVSFTIDPGHDSPPVLAAYAKLHGAAASRWFFLTGPQPTLNRLSLEEFKLGPVDASLEHSTRFVLVDTRSRIRGFYDTSESGGVPKLIADIFQLEREHS